MPDAKIGDILGCPEPVPGNCSLGEPLLSVRAIPENSAEYIKLAEALAVLSSEDPMLNFFWHKEEKQLHLKIMGAIQTEILIEILLDRFGIKARFTDPDVIYKETPSKSGYGIERYTMPKPCWAVLKLKIEPGARGSGAVYRSNLSSDKIQRKYQNEIEAAIEKAMDQGIKGWEVTDLKISLVDGEDHVVHSNPGDFLLAAPIALMNALSNTGTDLLEPILSYRIFAPDEFLGKITSEIISVRGDFRPAEIDHGHFELKGTVPLATSMDFSVRLSSITGGKAKYSIKFHGYEKCPEGAGKTRDYKGISPLDRSKYILKMRGAINQK
jgi:ribosomal protection tetracycline resistance protein